MATTSPLRSDAFGASPQTDAQRKALANQGLRNLRKLYRQFDTDGEKFERELDRLIARKTLVTSQSMIRLGEMLGAVEDDLARLTGAWVDTGYTTL